ncbi:MAG: M23 family metallopeptidase [Myxococcales bacterium]|nr:M23 family metallopeptidase [Myxococcales bacterium]MCB9713922.1 M23 family metallopeptidase [Myxococcales bacterium]
MACSDDSAAPGDAPPGPPREDVAPSPAEPPPGAFEIPGLDAMRPRPRLGWPVLSVHITSSFGWRMDPVSGRGVRLHRGVDFRGAIGDLVVSVGDGEVGFVGHDPFLGNLVVIEHGQGLQSLYGHLSDVLVVEGAPVERGAAIGLVGNTGRSAAPHLHLTIKLDGVAIDPLEVLGEPLHAPQALLGPPTPPLEPPGGTGAAETALVPDEGIASGTGMPAPDDERLGAPPAAPRDAFGGEDRSVGARDGS